MNIKFLLTMLFSLSVQGLLFTSAYAVTTFVDVGEVMDWRILDFSTTDVTYPNTVYFTLQFHNNGTMDLNVSGNLNIKKDTSIVYQGMVFEGNVSQQKYRNFTFNWTPSSSGDFLANLTINTTNEKIGIGNLTFTATSFTVYSQSSGSPGGGLPGTYIPEPSVTLIIFILVGITPVWLWLTDFRISDSPFLVISISIKGCIITLPSFRT